MYNTVLVSGRRSVILLLAWDFFVNTTYGRAKNIEKLSIHYHLSNKNIFDDAQ